jgi:histidine triad (HIT) family protein
MEADCIFCRIVAGEIPATVVADSEAALAFLDVAPWTDGHTIVIPRRHADDLLAIGDEDLAAVATLARRVAAGLVEAGAEGVNLWQSNRPAAGQTVFHLHVHVLPRHAGDRIRQPGSPG